MADQAIATAADYADAMLTARRAKNAVVLLLLLMLLLQIGLFFAVRLGKIDLDASFATTQPDTVKRVDLLHYLIGLTGFLGVALSVVLCAVVMLIVGIMLVGRLIGVARLTSTLIWCFLLGVLLFPWQAFLSNASFGDANFNRPEYSLKIPGALYTWDELRLFAHFSNEPLAQATLKWARFVCFPGLAVVMLLMIQAKSNRGIRQAFGEYDEAPIDRAATTTARTERTSRV